MKTMELRHSLHDVDENKGETRLTETVNYILRSVPQIVCAQPEFKERKVLGGNIQRILEAKVNLLGVAQPSESMWERHFSVASGHAW